MTAPARSHPCPDCGHTHAGTDTYAIGRFAPGDPTFRAQFPGSPERTTRAAAERDMCRWRAERQPKQGQESLL